MMLDISGRAFGARTSRPRVPETYTVELSQLLGGDIRVSLTATTIDEREADLLLSEIATERVATIDDALALVRANVAFS